MTTAPKCQSKTSLKLVPGDVVLEGNIFHGFNTRKFIGAVQSKHNKSMMVMTFEFGNGTPVSLAYGKNTRWSVVKAN